MNHVVLLSGIVGSTAYGMATPQSDIDRLGLYAEPTSRFHGLHLPVDKKGSKVSTKPDMAMHEARKFARLALAGNPTVSELLWLKSYEVREPLGQELIDIRRAFLSQRRAKDAYLGYASQQFGRLENKGKFQKIADDRDRVAKHARHLMRLVEQFCDLWTTGELSIEVKDPQRIHDFGNWVSLGNTGAAREMLERGERVARESKSALPPETDEPRVEAWLQRVRRDMWEKENA